ncbi:hypothetical protein EF847_15880 [Actinobacteria bacterium YIM 96077]|uniref:Uncharacterized protein n=1 Tax=Phytoactinopolyspora halophila TaxID=1981511 RepID=A0A329QAN2_9ACTN|nr:hypothetical protein EF847_15880 [Actinobacteria bacterium YIM 96077]RAW09396.1 hypothetical protein DPM12_21335 [Phytoactinopolyspora halophila]
MVGVDQIVRAGSDVDRVEERFHQPQPRWDAGSRAHPAMLPHLLDTFDGVKDTTGETVLLV